MEGIAIGLSTNSTEILKRLIKTEFVNDIYIAGSSKNKKDSIEVKKPKEILSKKWEQLDLIIFIGSIGASIRLINSYLTSKDKDPGVIVMDKEGSKIVPLIGSHQSNIKNIAFQISNLFNGEIIETSNTNNQNLLSLDSFGYQWGWKKSGKREDWSQLVIRQANNKVIFCKQLSGNNLWKTSKPGERINQLSSTENEKTNSTFHISIFNQYKNAWHPPLLWVGIGCERNTSKELIENSLNNFWSLIIFQNYQSQDLQPLI